MRRLVLIVLAATLIAAVAPAADRSLVYVRTTGESGPAFSAVGLELAAEIPGGYLAFLTDGDLARLAIMGTDHRVLARDQADTEILVKYEVGPDNPVTMLPPGAEVLYEEREFTILRLPRDESRDLSYLPDVQRVLRRPLRFVSRPWDGPLAAKSRVSDPDIQTMVDTVTEAWLEQQVQTLEDFGTRHSQYAGGEQASFWLRDQFFAYGYFDVTLHDYNSWNDNVVCVKTGSVYPDRYVVVGGHYDSTNGSDYANAPGADDNASGTVGMLATARALASYDFEYSIVFIAFSGEEQGLVGSEAWASQAADQGLDIVGCLALDMLGYRAAGDTADIDIITNSSSQPLRDLVDLAVADYVPGYTAVTGSLPGGASSDHVSFWSAGYRSVLFFEDSGSYSPYIHSTSDVVGVSVNDFAFMDRNVRTAVATAALLARPFRVAIDHEPLPHATGNGPFPVSCQIIAVEPLDPAALFLHYRIDGGALTTVPLTPSGEPDGFTADIPAQQPGALVEYYLEAADQLGRSVVDPEDAPVALYAFRTGVTNVLVDDAETDLGWSLVAAGDNATTGRWIWADPVGTAYQPENDHTPDPGHLCFVTGNAMPGEDPGVQDVDGGHTTLTTPIFDLAGADWAEISYWRYYVLATSYDDVFRIDISSDGGASWTNLETVTASAAWTRAAFELDGSAVALTAQMQLRFIAEDTGAGSLVEALIDDVVIVTTTGNPTPIEDAPVAVARLGAHPNPFNPQTTLSYTLPRSGFAELRIFDARGRQVARPVAAARPRGDSQLTWNAEGLASGVYLVQLRLDGAVLRSTKLTLVR